VCVCVSLCTFMYFICAADLLIVFPGRLLQISSFNGKMNALNEVNKVIASVTYYPHRHTGLEEEEWLTAERMAVSNTAVLSPRQLCGRFSLQRPGSLVLGQVLPQVLKVSHASFHFSNIFYP